MLEYESDKITKAKRSLFGILTLFVMHTLVLSAAADPSGYLHTALNHAGGNRSELETALRAAKGKDSEYLIIQVLRQALPVTGVSRRWVSTSVESGA